MLRVLIQKELKAIVLSPKFAATFGVCSLLILLSIFAGIQEYRAAVSQHEAALQLTDQSLRTRSSWMGIGTQAYRPPDPMMVFSGGVHNDVGRLSAIDRFSGIKLTNSPYADDPIFAIFRSIDLAFIVTVVLSLFAILFTYDAINGEREGGTLQLTFANPVPRARYILAKLVGSWLGLLVPLLIPILLGLLLVLLFGIPLLADHWLRLTIFLGMSLLYFTAFVAVGILVSSLTPRSSVSFLIGLVGWIAAVLIVPRLGVMGAGHMMQVPTIAEVEAQRDAFAKDRWEQHMGELEKLWQERERGMRGMSDAEREAYRDASLPDWMEEDDARRRGIQKEIDEYSALLTEDLRNRRAGQIRLGFAMSRISPAAAYQLAAMTLADTDIELKARYEDAMREYRTAFLQFVEKKQKETGGTGGFQITVDSNEGVKFSMPRESGSLDLSGLPAFSPPRSSLSHIAPALIIDAGILALYTLLAFAGAFLAFLKYDLR